MFQLGQLAGRGLLIEHRHSDGTWSPLEPAPQHHDASQHDPERDWARGEVFRCAACEEEVRISAGVPDLNEGA
jgi:hypothetical protein